MPGTLVAEISYNALFILVVIVLTFLAKTLDDWRTSRFDDTREIVQGKNIAVAIRRSGLYLGGIVAMSGVLSGSAKGIWEDLREVTLYGLLSYALLFLSRWLCQKLMLGGLDNDGEIQKGNVAVGLVEFGIFLASGIMINGAVTGDSSGWDGLANTLLFFALGQLLLILTIFLYQKLTPYNDCTELSGDNRAVAIMFVGIPIALSLILRSSLIGPSESLLGGILSFLTRAMAGIVLLLLLNLVLKFLFFRGAPWTTSIKEEKNLALALVLQVLTIAFAYLLSSAVI